LVHLINVDIWEDTLPYDLDLTSHFAICTKQIVGGSCPGVQLRQVYLSPLSEVFRVRGQGQILLVESGYDKGQAQAGGEG